MNEQVSVIISGKNPDVVGSLTADMDALGFFTEEISYDDLSRNRFNEMPDVILLDLTICDRDALAVCHHVFQDEVLPVETSIVALVSKISMGQIPAEYNFTDIIMFPYDISELGFRIRRAAHISGQEPARDIIRIGNLSISPSRYEVKVDGKPVVLSHKEYELLKYLITHPNNVFTRERLLTSIWGGALENTSRTVDVHIRRVRAKIGDFTETYIKTVRGVGYAFRANDR